MGQINILSSLNERGTCHAVGCGKVMLRGAEDYGHGDDYFIIIRKKDLCDEYKHRSFKFYRDYRVYVRHLKENELKYFQENQDKYKRVLLNDFGAVYELKSNSFKKMLPG